ncbi:MAG TPA: hypothetical protein VK970_22490, partial [Candidatus Methylacidiphilales bacterium]|nr:hypothetical protein [Candidatus Methylacidiphilales bacterium]
MPALLYNAQSLPPALNAAFPQAAAYVRAFADGRSAELVTNVRTEMLALHLTAADSSAEGGLLLPITVN